VQALSCGVLACCCWLCSWSIAVASSSWSWGDTTLQQLLSVLTVCPLLLLLVAVAATAAVPVLLTAAGGGFDAAALQGC
jgi:hypothetical protein